MVEMRMFTERCWHTEVCHSLSNTIMFFINAQSIMRQFSWTQNRFILIGLLECEILLKRQKFACWKFLRYSRLQRKRENYKHAKNGK